MAVYSGAVRSITPSLTDDNWALTAGASKSGKILELWCGGEATTSTAMCTRHARASGQTGASTAGNTEKMHPNSPAKGFGFVTSFATTQPTLENGDLWVTSWNAHGGVVRVLFAPGEEPVLIGATTELCIVSRNTVGTATSSYGCAWQED